MYSHTRLYARFISDKLFFRERREATDGSGRSGRVIFVFSKKNEYLRPDEVGKGAWERTTRDMGEKAFLDDS